MWEVSGGGVGAEPSPGGSASHFSASSWSMFEGAYLSRKLDIKHIKSSDILYIIHLGGSTQAVGSTEARLWEEPGCVPMLSGKLWRS